MTGPQREIGIFDAIYSLMEHAQRLQGAQLSGQRVAALQAGDAALFDQTSQRIALSDAQLTVILQLRAQQAAEFEAKGLIQPGMTMAAKLHEYMLSLSGGRLPESHNGHIPDEPAQPTEPLAVFKALITKESSWDISSKALTQKLAGGKYPFGIRPARLMLASVKYDANLERLHPRRSRAIQEAFVDGSKHAIVSNEIADMAVTRFINDFMQRKEDRLRELPQEVRDTIDRIKTDPILGLLSKDIQGRAKLLAYALYQQSLQQVLLDSSSVTPVNPS